ncbi:XRE family transcriptional regulator [Roseibium sediminis]|uniref:XRE family transcriptional regulator n=1 Tax=Roseibium sediminis TaxID=1775174 RepID=UPI00123D6F80|nr:XRE family transcriptional regulator [Roseibium sediminis]
MGFGTRVKFLARDKGLSLKDFSTELDIPYRTLMRYLTDERDPSLQLAQKICAYFGVSLEWLATGREVKSTAHQTGKRAVISDEQEFVPIKRFDVEVSAGYGSLVEAEIGTAYYAFNRSWLKRRDLNPDDLSVLAVRGDSMEPELHDGDLILLDRANTDPADGDICVVRYSNELFVKRVQMMPNSRIALLSTNSFYSPITINPREDDDLAFVGKVVASMHEW